MTFSEYQRPKAESPPKVFHQSTLRDLKRLTIQIFLKQVQPKKNLEKPFENPEVSSHDQISSIFDLLGSRCML